MFCTNCGTRIGDGANFCPGCGGRVDSAGRLAHAHGGVVTVTPGASLAPSDGTRPKRAVWKRVLAWAGAFIAGVIALATFVTADLQATVEAHLKALREGDLPAAYAQTSLGFRQATPLGAFREFVAAYPVLTAQRDFTLDERGFENNAGYVKGSLSDGDRDLARVEFQMVKEDNEWRIQGVELSPVH
jgi:hypothetical protein